jgi:hypothetical protein
MSVWVSQLYLLVLLRNGPLVCRTQLQWARTVAGRAQGKLVMEDMTTHLRQSGQVGERASVYGALLLQGLWSSA